MHRGRRSTEPSPLERDSGDLHWPPFLGPWENSYGRAAWLLGCKEWALEQYERSWPGRSAISSAARAERAHLGEDPALGGSSDRRQVAMRRLADVIRDVFASEQRQAANWRQARQVNNELGAITRGKASTVRTGTALRVRNEMREREVAVCEHGFVKPFCPTEPCRNWGGRGAGTSPDWREPGPE